MRKSFLTTVLAAATLALTACNGGGADMEAAASAARSLDLAEMKTRGREPGDAFIIRFADGFNPETQYLSEYNIAEPWMDTYFSAANVRYSDQGATLVIEKREQQGQPYTGAEFQQLGFYGYGRYETIMRGAEGQGVVSGFFTHTHSQFDGDPHDEIDFEYMGKNTRQLHLNHFKDGEPAGSTYIDLPFDFTEAEHLYAFEWAPDAIRWYVDGEKIYETFEHIPDHSGRVIVSAYVVGEASYGWAGQPTFETPRESFFRCISHVPLGETGPQCSDTFSPAD